MIKTKLYLLLLFLILLIQKIEAQHPYFFQFTEKDGLPDIEYYDIYEDKKGIIWLAANTGLYSYNGKEFKNYTNDKKRALSVFGLKEDNLGRIWCNNISGQYFFVNGGKLELFIDLKEYTKDQLALFYFFDNEMIVVSDTKILSIDLKTKDIKIKNQYNGIISYSLKKNDSLFYLQNKTLKYISSKESKGVKLKAENNNTIFNANFAFNFNNNFIHQSFDRKLEKSILYFNNKRTDLFKNSNSRKESIITGVLNESSKIWLCFRDAVYVYAYSNNEFKLSNTYFEGKEITKILKDSRGNYWFISASTGIYIIPNLGIEKYNLPEKNTNISVIENINDQYLIAGSTNGKLTSINLESGKATQIKNPFFERVNQIAYNKKDEIYVSLTSRSFVLNSENFSLKKNSKANQFDFRNAKSLSIIDENRFIYSSFAYAEILDKEKNESLRLGRKRSYANFYSKKRQEIYVNYVDGLYCYQINGDSKELKFNNESIFGVDIEETSNGIIWISTFNHGLIALENGKLSRVYRISEGLLSNQIRKIKSDGNYLWIISDNGVQLFNSELNEFKNLTEIDGIGNYRITDLVVLKDKIALGTNKGVYSFDKQKVFRKQKLYDFYIENVYINDKIRATSSEYFLDPEERKIQFDLHINGYKSQSNITYFYRFKNKDQKWTSIPKNSNTLVFNSLQPGYYELEIKGKENFSSRETNTKSIQLNIKSPFYKTWWFILVLTIILLLILSYYYKKRIVEKEKEMELISLKLENLRSQMNPHFIFNALNSIQDYIMQNQKRVAVEYLGMFSNLIRVYLGHSSQSEIYLSDEIATLDTYLSIEKLRFRDTLSFRIDVDKRIETQEIKIPTMLIQPYIENSLKHGLLNKKGDRKLTVSFNLSEDQKFIICKIIDNGVGRVKANQIKTRKYKYHKSFATKTTENRLELLNSIKYNNLNVETIDLYDTNNEPSGTEVIIKIPNN
ncbi:histidine kinase [Tenacibaculum sp. 190524A05c]|uniref:sensor histidine kinase n=1 Tax=Tenacibaculum platacis TaxID=3137852 RepID=UPI0032B2CED4